MTVHVLKPADLKRVAMTVEVRLPRWFGLRVWLMLRLLKMAAWIAPVGVDVKEKRNG